MLDAPVDIGLARTGRRGDPDRLDSEQADFYTRVRETYLGLAAAEPDRFVVIDASGSLDDVGAAVDEVGRRLVAAIQD